MGWIILAVLLGAAILVIGLFVALASHVDPPPDGKPETAEQMEARVMARHRRFDEARSKGFSSVQEMEEAQRIADDPYAEGKVGPPIPGGLKAGQVDFNMNNQPVPNDVEILPVSGITALVGETYRQQNIRAVLGKRRVGGPASGPTPTETAYIFREPNNPYDLGSAVVVMMESMSGGQLLRVGYIAADRTSLWHKSIDEATSQGKVLACEAQFYRRKKREGLGSIEIQLKARPPK